MYVAQPLVLIVYNIYFTAATLLLFIMFLLTLHIGYAYFSTTRTLSTRARPRAQPPRARLDSRAVNTRYLLCSPRFMPDDVMLTSVVCPVHVICSASCSGNNIGRCISAVHIRRRCSAGIRQQCFVAEWLGLSVTVRVRVRARAREWNPFLLFFFLLCKCGGHHLLCSPGAWPALSMSHVSMTSLGMKRGEQSGSVNTRVYPHSRVLAPCE